jgi:hypothetical protein
MNWMEEYQKLPHNIRAQLLQYSVKSGQPLMGLLQQYLVEKSNQGERTPPLRRPQIEQQIRNFGLFGPKEEEEYLRGGR